MLRLIPNNVSVRINQSMLQGGNVPRHRKRITNYSRNDKNEHGGEFEKRGARSPREMSLTHEKIAFQEIPASQKLWSTCKTQPSHNQARADTRHAIHSEQVQVRRIILFLRSPPYNTENKSEGPDITIQSRGCKMLMDKYFCFYFVENR